jgi:hypothetical protein
MIVGGECMPGKFQSFTPMSLFEILSLLLNAVLVAAAFVAVRQININRKQLYLSTISKCIEDFKSFRKLDSQTEDASLIHDYLELTNEELFYFQNKYLPEEVAIEWIGGMIDFLPITNEEREIPNSNYCIKVLADNRDKFLSPYPRIKHAFEIKKPCDFDLVYSEDYKQRKERIRERKKVIKQILINIADFDGYTE